MPVDNTVDGPVDSRGHEPQNPRSDRGHPPWTPDGGPDRGHSGGGLYTPGVPAGDSQKRSTDRLLDLLEVALDDCGIFVRASIKVRLRARFVELADVEGYHVVRQPPAVLDLDDVGRHIDHAWERER